VVSALKKKQKQKQKKTSKVNTILKVVIFKHSVILFIPRLNVYAAGFLLGMIGSKGDLKQGILGALTAGFIHLFIPLSQFLCLR
jgi:hypothetical protein